MNNGIYIHIPFCRSKCAYCDFNSKAGIMELADTYVDALIAEMKALGNVEADSVYIGGGTPTVLSEKQLDRVLSAINDCFLLKENAEFTVETNPATADRRKYSLLKNYGVNRLSVGVQSFNENELLALSRIHTPADAENAVYTAKECGIENISIDLMDGIPYQSPESLKYSIDRALSLGVRHISVYSLIIEEGTPFYENTPPLPDEDAEREMYALTRKILTENGFRHYEISNYAKPGYEAYHNMKYWKRAPYYGFGAGAHSFYNNTRYENIREVEKYIAADCKVVYTEEISASEALKEKFMLGFRMLDGFDTKGQFEEKIHKLHRNGLIERNGNWVRLTEKGEDLANLVFMEFVGDI